MTPDSADTNLLDEFGGSSEAEGRRRRQKLLSLLRGRYHWAIAAALLLGVSGAIAGYYFEVDKYTSAAQLEIRPQVPSTDGGPSHVPPMWNEFVNTRLSAMHTARVIESAMASDVWRQAVAKAGIEYSVPQFARGIDYERVSQSNLVDVRFEATDPRLALAGLDALVTAYMQVFEDIESQSDAALLRALNDQRAKLNSDIQLWTYQRQQVSDEGGAESLQRRFDFSLTQVLKLEAEISAINRILGGGGDEAANGDESPLDELSIAELIARDATLSQRHLERQEMERHINGLKLQGFNENHRAVQQARAQLTILDQQIAERVQLLRSGQVLPDGIVPGMGGTADREQLRAHKQMLDQQLIEAKARTDSLAERLTKVQTIESQIADARIKLQNIENRIDRMDMEKLLSGRLSLRAGASTPGDPSNGGRRVKLAGLFGVGGAGLGVGLILLIGLLDPRLRHIEDAELDLPAARMLGTLPTLPADLVDPEQAVLVAHSVHHIRTLLQIGREPQGNVFSITSPAPGSGKTSLTMALGLSFASSGAKTLLIDADIVGGGLTRRMGFVVHPRVGQVLLQQGLISEPQINEALRVAQGTGVKFGQALVDLGYVSREDLEDALISQRDESIGLLEACGEHRFEECVAPTGIRNLYLLPIGTALPQQAGALSPAAIRRVIQQARSQFDTVLIDTGPLLGSLEASMAASEATATVFIVSRGDQKPLVTKCVEQLQRVGGRLAGVVFNHALAHDIARSTYGSVTMSQSRHPNNRANVEPVDADTSARFGPLATAVASYAAGGNDTRRKPRSTAGPAPGQTGGAHSNGKGAANGAAHNGKLNAGPGAGH